MVTDGALRSESCINRYDQHLPNQLHIELCTTKEYQHDSKMSAHIHP